ncbi:MAG: ribonuclease H-like domain-containing protein [Planctomycetes bacterium]|nr:ribonuclease H-like domain-containing protein [Planctomycetota bacterium]
MIKESLLHCAGIGPVRLAQLHEAGVRSWHDVLRDVERLPIGSSAPLVEECDRCIDALETKNIRYFVDHLAPLDKWRIVSEFLDETSFFDIETTGLEHDSRITVIACWHRGEVLTFVEHENLDDFLRLLDDVTLLASFNGSSFDVPRVLDAFHIPHLPCPHLDLRWPCYHKGFRGSLKSITARLGFARPFDLQDADGELAVHLWNRWTLDQDHGARDLLLRYCASDVILLAMLAHRLADRVITSPADWWLPLPSKTELPCAATPVASTTRSTFGVGSPSKLRARGKRTA